MRALLGATRALLALVLLALAASAFAAPKDRGQQWASLTADQQQALAPLQNDWPRMSKEQKVKWIGITKRWPSMKPEEQKRAQARMQKWVKLTPEQRMQAREQYRSIATKVAPDRKEQLRRYWVEYQGRARPQQGAAAPPVGGIPVAAAARKAHVRRAAHLCEAG
jgi:hypothetical protein